MGQFLFLTWIISFLYIWFDTDAIPEWLKAFGFKKIYQKYKEDAQKSPHFLDFPAFLNKYNKNFFFNLIACPICLSVWLVWILNLILKISWQNIALNVIITWIGYFLLRWIIKKLNE